MSCEHQALGGRGIPGRIGSRLPSGHLRRTQALYNEAKDLLTFLKSFGAFLHHVRPEQLLNRCVLDTLTRSSLHHRAVEGGLRQGVCWRFTYLRCVVVVFAQ